MHQFTSKTAYFDSGPTQIFPHLLNLNHCEKSRHDQLGRSVLCLLSDEPLGNAKMDASDYNLIELLDHIYLNEYCCPMPPKWAELSNHVCLAVDHANHRLVIRRL